MITNGAGINALDRGRRMEGKNLGGTGDAFNMTVTNAVTNASSGHIDRTFDVTASQSGGAVQPLKGSFHACRAPDQRLP